MPKLATITIRVPEKIKKKVEKVAAADQRSVANFFVRLLAEHAGIR